MTFLERVKRFFFGSDEPQSSHVGHGTVVFVAGAPRSGKTTLLTDAATHAIAGGCKIIMLDLTGDTAKYLRKSGASVQSVTDAAGAERAVAWAQVVSFTITRRSSVSMEVVASEWLAFCASRRKPGDWYLCDEAELVFPHHASDDARKLVKFAGNDGYLLGLATQRPQLTDGIARSNAEHVCVFRADSEQFVETGCKEFGHTPLYKKALELRRGEYLYRNRYAERRFDEPLPVLTNESRAPFVDAWATEET